MWVFIALLFHQIEEDHWAYRFFTFTFVGVVISWIPPYYFGFLLRIAEKIHVNFYNEIEKTHKNDQNDLQNRFQVKNSIIYFLFYASVFWFYAGSLVVMTWLMQDIGRLAGWVYVGSCLLGVVLEVLILDFIPVIICAIIRPSLYFFRLRGYYFDHEAQLKMTQYDEAHPY